MSEKKYPIDKEKLSPEGQLIYNIIEQWGNVIAMPKMEGWIREYGDNRMKAKPGPGWVKASERLPVKDGYYCFKANGGYMGAYLRTASNGSRWFCDSAGGTIRSWKQCEWLDESPAEQPVREVTAEMFAKYLDEQRSAHTANMWHEKAIWDKPNAFQEWLKYFKQQLPAEWSGEKEGKPKEAIVIHNNSDAFRHWVSDIKGYSFTLLGHSTGVWLPPDITLEMFESEWEAYEKANNPAKKEGKS